MTTRGFRRFYKTRLDPVIYGGGGESPTTSGSRPLNLGDAPKLVATGGESEIVAINEAIEALGQFDPCKEKVVELRFFGDLSVGETAEVPKISPQSVIQDWKIARAWLLTELQFS